jgi:hypothetical protein
MDKVSFIEIADSISGDIKEHAIIERADGSFTSMSKEHYLEQQAAITDVPAAKS